MQKLCFDKYQNLDDLEAVKNREDRSALIIHSLFPERFLSEEIAHPDEVKRLAIYLSFDNYEGYSCGCRRNRHGNNICKDCFVWESKYNNTLCSGLTKFHNLETLCVVDLDLSCDLWIEFARNCTCLKELCITSSEKSCYFFYDKDKALYVLFQIPTLEKVCINNVCLPYFPPGPSNIKHLELKSVYEDDDEEEQRKAYEIYSNNLHTHQNIKTLILNEQSPKPYNVLNLKLDQMQLEELVLESSTFDDIVIVITSLPQTLKRLKFSVSFSDISDAEKLINALRSIFDAQIEEIEIQVSTNIYDYVVRRIRVEFASNSRRLRDEYPTLKKFVFLDYDNRLVLDVLGDETIACTRS
jgi:hypothetical protein